MTLEDMIMAYEEQHAEINESRADDDLFIAGDKQPITINAEHKQEQQNIELNINANGFQSRRQNTNVHNLHTIKKKPKNSQIKDMIIKSKQMIC